MKSKYIGDYDKEISHIFNFRINLFCYIAIFSFLLEIIIALLFYKNLISQKDLPGIIGGTFFSILLLLTSKFAKTLTVQKVRAFLFSFLLILISILAASAHPEIISYLGITLILIAFFSSVLLLPWDLKETIIIGIFTFINFLWIYPLSKATVNSEIFGINSILLFVSIVVACIVKKSESVLRKKDFILRKNIEEKNRVMAKELELAKKIHKSIMPHSISHKLAEVSVVYRPMFYLGGDYAKFEFTDNNKLIFAVCDITGHGVSSALLVNRVHTEFERLMRQHLMPGQILKKLDEFINNDFGKMGIFLSAFCGMLDFSNNKLVYSNYGHPPQILFQPKNNNVYLMSSQTFLMGVGLADSNIYSSEVSFEKGDRLLLFTDGITEAKNKSGEMFGQKRLEEIAKNNKHLNVAEFNNFLINTIDKFQSNNQTDDIFILTIQSK